MDEKLFDELIRMQEEKVADCGRRIIPNLTSDDLLQPCDFLELDTNPHFRYEEGVLEGLKTARMAFIAKSRETSCC